MVEGADMARGIDEFFRCPGISSGTSTSWQVVPPGAENMLRLDRIIRKTGGEKSGLFQTICIFKVHGPTHRKRSSRIVRLIPLPPPPHCATAPHARIDKGFLGRVQDLNSAVL